MKVMISALLIGAATSLAAKTAIDIDFEALPHALYSSDAILRGDPLFVDDFLTLHTLLCSVKPTSVFEIGTCTGEGTLIIKNAVGQSPVYSLELPYGESSYDIHIIGERCTLPYTQLLGDSLRFDYTSCYPIDAWFIDGAHDYQHVFFETKQALLSAPALIVWHDADIPEVFEAIKDGVDDSEYTLFRVVNTRVAFAIPSTSVLMEILND